MTLRIAGSARESIVDGEGLRYALFTQGCPHRCPGCHNPQTHPFAGGQELPVQQLWQDIRKNPLLDGITLSGGEPFCQALAAAELAALAQGAGLNVWVYTGYTLEELLQSAPARALLRCTDVLVDGRFDQGLRTLELPFRGSRNQRLLDARRSLALERAMPATPAAPAICNLPCLGQHEMGSAR